MSKIYPFEKYAGQYDEWFEKNRWVYGAELRAIDISLGPRNMASDRVSSLEVGVGTGRFAGPLGIKIGVEPSKRMREIAQKRGITCIGAVAEELPFEDSRFDFVLMVTTICFVDDIGEALRETHRVLSPGGILVIGFIDRNSMVGQTYLDLQDKNVFYRNATFFSVDNIVEYMNRAGFKDLAFFQTIFGTLADITKQEPVKPGHGEGSFVVIRGRKGQVD
jgi:SAM-dependent methyltransferase